MAETKKNTKKGKRRRGSNQGKVMMRYFFIIFLLVVWTCSIIYKLFSTTVINAHHWEEKALSLMPKEVEIKPERGDILASDGTVLVTNLYYYDIHIDFGSEGFKHKLFAEKIDALSDSLAKYFPQRSASEWKSTMQQQHDKEKKPRYYRLLKGITFAELERLKTFPFFDQKNRNHSGLIPNAVATRSYPYGDMARRSIGRVGHPEKDTIKGIDLSDEIHGISGLEKALDAELYGVPGLYRPVTMTHSIGKWVEEPAIPGWNITTTINIGLQDMLENELETMLRETNSEWACAVLMEVKTGDILAISNLEQSASDPDKYVEAVNRAVIGYEPGSVVKGMSMMFALEDGYCPPLDKEIEIGSSWTYAKRRIVDSHVSNRLTPLGVIEQSSNIGISKITTAYYDTCPEAFPLRFEKIGFFDKMNSGIAEEEKPYIPLHPKRMDMAGMSFGYSTALPPLYTLAFYNAIANKGVMVRPRLVKKMSRQGVDSIIPVSYMRERICSEKNAAILTEMLESVVTKGTARYINNPTVKIAGKTGTANYLDMSSIPYHYDKTRNRLAFAGFFPADNPQYSCMVLTFHPRGNRTGPASTSGVVVRNMALKMYARGMLNNSADYHDNAPENPDTSPRLTSTAYNTTRSDLAAALGSSNSPVQIKSGYAPAVGDSLPPLVTRLGLREAVAILEKAGYEVDFDGTGTVTEQWLDENRRLVHLRLK